MESRAFLTTTKRNLKSRHVIAYDSSTDHGHAPLSLECENCGSTAAPTQPIAVTDYVIFSKQFEKAHRKCKRRESL